MKISISGTPGSGKSVLARDLAEALGLTYYNGGDMRREEAKKRGMTLAEFNALGEKESWTDTDTDEEIERIGKEEDEFVFEGRLAWHFIPDSVKIFLDANEEVRAKRILPRKLEEESFETVQQAIKSNKERIESDKKRYMKYYGIDCYDQSHYDLVIDSTDKTPKQVLREVLEFLDR